MAFRIRIASSDRRDAVGVVGGAGAGMPRVEVRADHDDLGLQLRIRCRADPGDHVVAVGIVGDEMRLHVDAQLDGHAAFEHARDHVVVLAGQDHRRHCVLALIAAEDEDGPVLALAGLELDADARLAHRLGDRAGVGLVRPRRHPRRLADPHRACPTGSAADDPRA